MANILFIDANNTVFSTREEFTAKAIHGQSIRNTQANKLFAEVAFQRVGNYQLGNEQDIRIHKNKMLLFVNPIKKFVTIGIKAS